MFKKIAVYFTVLSFTLSGIPAFSQDEEADATVEEEAVVEEEETGIAAGVWIAITGAVLALFSGGSDAEPPAPAPTPVPPTPTPTPTPTRIIRNRITVPFGWCSSINEPCLDYWY